jgi:hypothetical protein
MSQIELRILMAAIVIFGGWPSGTNRYDAMTLRTSSINAGPMLT